mmetsp:Transcript_28841/g.64754  ORF Transcript_28841/g.64754 Transcript_28841/m.64754 type:complete len:231 (+) Transcript_28841:329-1021(+)
MRFFISCTTSGCLECLDAMRHASDVSTSATTSRPAARMVVPVSTRSTMPSARPRPHAASTDPDTYLICVGLPGLSYLSKKALARLGKEVTMRLPDSSSGLLMPHWVGAWMHSLHLPRPSCKICSTSTSDSLTTSRPVMPASTSPSPTYVAISAAGRNTNVMGKDVQCATSNLLGRMWSRPAPSSSLMHASYNLPFFGTARRAFCCSVLSACKVQTLDSLMAVSAALIVKG